jgi:aconitase A
VVVFAEVTVVGREPRHGCIRVVVVGSYGRKHLQAVVEAGVCQMGFESAPTEVTVAISLEVEDTTAAVEVEEEEEEDVMVHRGQLSRTVEDDVVEPDRTCLHRVC